MHRSAFRRLSLVNGVATGPILLGFTLPIFVGEHVNLGIGQGVVLFFKPFGFVQVVPAGFVLTSFARLPLLLFESELLLVGLVPEAGLHQPLIGPMAAVGRRNIGLLFIQLNGELSEVIHALQVRRWHLALPQKSHVARFHVMRSRMSAGGRFHWATFDFARPGA